MNASNTPLVIHTIGHSTRSIETSLELLRIHGVEQLVDVRTVPGSRRHCQFNREALARQLEGAGIAYHHLKALGGLRRPRADSPNTGWDHAGFRGFADYMQTQAFSDALHGLIQAASSRRTAIMCAEAVPWRCHRSLIADALVVRGIRVEHILSGRKAYAHQLTSFSHVEGTTVRYPIPPFS